MRGRGQGWGMLTVKLLMFTWLERRTQTQTIPHSNIQFLPGNNFTHSLTAIQYSISISVPLGWQMNNVLLNNTQLKCKESFTTWYSTHQLLFAFTPEVGSHSCWGNYFLSELAGKTPQCCNVPQNSSATTSHRTDQLSHSQISLDSRKLFTESLKHECLLPSAQTGLFFLSF